jgi:O-antigen/teichoic acid export membrane protein
MHILTFVLNLIFFKYYSSFQFQFQFKSDVVIELIKYSKLIYIGNIAGNLNAYYPKFFITIFLGTTYLGIYDIVSKIPNVIKNMLGIANAILVPVASELAAKGREKDNSKLFLQGLKLNILFYIPFIAVFIFYSEPILKIWIGIEYMKYSFLMQILMLLPLLSLFISQGNSILGGMNKKLKVLTSIVWVIMTINLIFTFLTITDYQLYGVSISRWIGLILVLPYVNSIFIKIFDLDTKKYLIMISVIIIEFLLFYIISLYIFEKVTINNAFELIFASIITYFMYFFIIYFSIYTQTDKEFLKSIKSKLLKKVK